MDAHGAGPVDTLERCRAVDQWARAYSQNVAHAARMRS